MTVRTPCLVHVCAHVRMSTHLDAVMEWVLEWDEGRREVGEGVVQVVGVVQAGTCESSTELLGAEEGGERKKGGGNTSVTTAVQDRCCVDYTEWLQ